ncbi:MAG TPA: DEAD/DEAH box helicase [Caulobacteraceae bacterium]
MTDFTDLGLSPSTLQAVADTGYSAATPIQAQAIPVVLAGRDVLGIAQTGTGKTAAFTLPMIDRLVAGRSKARMPRSLVIEPTRELADQVALAFDRYSKGQKLTWALLIGGVSFGDQEMKLDRGVDVLIATPGRLLDHFERGKLLMTGVQILVVDEADRMLDMGFIPDIERIFKLTPAKKQTLFFSATMPPEITRLTKQFLNDPVRIEASRPATAAENIAQHIVRVPSADPGTKRLALRTLAGRDQVRNGIVFCNRKSEVDVVAKSLKKHGFNAAPIHGDLDQSTRTRTLEAFRQGELKLLVASDVAARGLDIPDVSHIFNYDVPHHADDYVHRIGRTGRAGKSGEAFMLVTPADGRALDKVLKLIGSSPDEVTLDVDWSSATVGGRVRDDRRGAREDRPGARGGRDRGRGRPASETSVAAMAPLTPQPLATGIPVASSAPSAQPPSAPNPEPRRGQRRRRERQPRRPESPKPQSAAPERAAPPGETAPAEHRRGVQPVAARDDDRGVVGFGSDTPAFLARPAPKTGED